MIPYTHRIGLSGRSRTAQPIFGRFTLILSRLGIGAVLAYTCLCSTFTSSIFSASTETVSLVFGVSVEVAILSTSLFVLGYAFGPLIWGPFSELQGRKLPITIAIFGFTLFNFAVASADNLQTIMICRFFTGFFGSGPLAIVAAVFADMFDNTQRGTAIVIFASMVFMGPMLGPFIGGFVQASYLGWRWNVYFPGIMGCAALFLIIFVVKESYPPKILVSKASELRRRTKNWGIHAKQEEVEVDLNELITKNFSRPLRLLVTEPVIFLVTLYMSFIYGLLYCFLTAYPLVFAGVHHIKPGVSGLPFFGMVLGIFIVAAYIIWDSKAYNKKLAANGGIPVPEWRLPPVIIGGVVFSAGLFWFGWTGFTDSIPWIVPTLSGLFTGFGLLAIFICLFNYIIDSYLML
jgi:MFS transporter, DHA1 family, multidrug resistance protein